jgi:hypothetical protein
MAAAKISDADAEKLFTIITNGPSTQFFDLDHKTSFFYLQILFEQ